ncbi:MAG: ribosome recycling factor [Candidatus Sericytochromatia bacterium]
MLDNIFSELEEKMKKTIESVKRDFASIRTGRANASILDRIQVESYGAMTAIKNIAKVATPDAKTITITPFEKNMLSVIDKALQKSDIGITPQNDGQMIRLVMPQMTQEIRKDRVKVMKKASEEGKVAIRNERRTAVDKIKKLEKDSKIAEDESKKAQDKVQKSTDKYTAEIDKLAEAKEKEIMEI